MSFNLSKAGKVTRVMNAQAAATTDSTGSSVDMQGYDSVCFYASFGAITATAVTSVKAQQSSDDAVADAFADLLGTAISVSTTNGNDVVVLDISHPRERYVRPIVDRGTANAVIDGIIAVQYNANVEPVTHDTTTVVGAELHHAPAEGTA